MLEPPDFYSDLSIAQLVKLARKGDEMAYTVLYFRFWKTLKKMCMIYGVRCDDHDDLITKTCTKVFRKINEIEPEKFAGYITMAMRNDIKNYFAKIDREREIFVPEYPQAEDSDNELHSILERFGISPDQAINITGEMILEIILKVLNRMDMDKKDEKYRDVLMLDIEGYSYQEISELLDINPKTVGPRLYRARRMFIKYFKMDFPGWYDELF